MGGCGNPVVPGTVTGGTGTRVASAVGVQVKAKRNRPSPPHSYPLQNPPYSCSVSPSITSALPNAPH